jgi:DNA end-binding protein Ku
VSVDVNLWPALRKGRPSLREVATDGTPLRRLFYCPKDERIVRPDEIVRGFEFDDDRFVVVTERELEDLEPQKSREIDLQRFVDRRDIPFSLYERGYYLAPGGNSTKAYRLLAEVLESTRRVGIATFIMRDREYLVAIIGEAGILRAETLRFADEVRKPEDVGLSDNPRPDRRLSSRFQRLIKSHKKDSVAVRELDDEYGERLRELVEKKRKQHVDLVQIDEGPEPLETDDGEPADSGDLLEAIRRSLQGRGRPVGSSERASFGSNGHADRNGESVQPRNRQGKHRRRSSTHPESHSQKNRSPKRRK